jgi:hypothetical protein
MPQIKIATTPSIAILASMIYFSSAAASTVDNVYGIVNAGSHPGDGGLDSDGYAYSVTLLGSSVRWAGSAFTLGAAGTADAASDTTITLPAGNHATLNLLATAVNGSQIDQTFVVTYTDGSATSFIRSLSDWCDPQNYAGESQALKMAYRIAPSGAAVTGPVYVYGYSLAINSAKTVQSISLPRNRNVVVLAVNGSLTSSNVQAAAAPGLSPAPGTYTAAQSVKLSDSTPQALIYYTTNGTTPTTSANLYTVGTPLNISSTTTLKAIAVASGYSSSAVTSGTYTVVSATSAPTTVLKISGTPATTAEAGQYYGFTPTVVAPGGVSLRYGVANRPGWAQFNSATGTLSGTPATSGVGTDGNIVISVSDGAQSAVLPAFSIVVDPAAQSSADTATVSWTAPTLNTNGTPLMNLSGYVVHYGTSSTALNSQISVGGAGSTGVAIENLSAGTWYFEVAALTTAGVESEFSSIVSKSIP